MDWWLAVILAVGLALLGLLAAAYVVWRRLSRRARRLASRVQRLNWRRRLQLAQALLSEQRLPLPARLAGGGLVLYLAMPIDFVPDFVPVLGQVDDAVMLAAGLALVFKAASLQVLESRLAEMEVQSTEC